MQPLKWDTTSRTAADSVNIYVVPESPRTSQFESFGSHFQNSPVGSSSSQQRSESQPRSPRDDSYGAMRSSGSSEEDNDLQENRQQPVVEQAADTDADRDPSAASDDVTSQQADPENLQETKAEPTVPTSERPGTAPHLDQRKMIAKTSTVDIEEAASDELPRNKPTSRVKRAKGVKPKSIPAVAKQETGELDNTSRDTTATVSSPEVQSGPGGVDAKPEKTPDSDHVPVTEIATTLQTVTVVDPIVNSANRSTNGDSKTAKSDSRKAHNASRKEAVAVESVAASVQSSENKLNPTGQEVAVEIAGLTSAKTEQVTMAPTETTETGDLNASVPASPRLRFAQHLAAKPGERVAKSSPFTDVEQTRLVERVARAFRTAEGRGGVVTLRLHPPELGALRVELRVQDGVMSARLEAETSAARSLLIDNAHILRDRLAEQGVRIERFDVDLLDRRPPGDTPTFDQQGPRDQTDRRPTTIPIAPLEPTEFDSPRPPARPNVDEQLNVIV